MYEDISRAGSAVIGMDLSDRWSTVCELSWEDGEVSAERKVKTTREGMEEAFGERERCRIATEVGPHSAWVSELLESLGHEVIVANPRKVRLIGENRCKDDRLDAERLARLARVDVKLLAPIRHRRGRARRDLTLVKAREALVRSRTALINHIRGVAKACGIKVPECSTPAFHLRAVEVLPEELLEVLAPLVESLAHLSRQIRRYDREVERTVKAVYPEAERLRQIRGVGPLTALTYALVVWRPERFDSSAKVASYLGLVPARRDSGDTRPELGITKEGDVLTRKLLVQAAHYILGPFGPDCDLRRFGLRLIARGGQGAKKRARVAVARKLAVVMHRLWVSGEDYDPFFVARQRGEAPEAA